MVFRVGYILQPSIAVIHRLDTEATRLDNPDGEPDSGYDDTFREPMVYDKAKERVTSRKESAAIRIPCQVEIATEEQLRELHTGDDPVSNMIFVFHRAVLEQHGLLDIDTRDVLLKKGDRISAIEKFGAPVGTVVKKITGDGLYVVQMRSASFGFGPDGHDLELAIMTNRQLGPTV